MIDTHCHLYSKEFDSDRQDMIGRGIAAGVDKFYLPAIDSETHDAMIALEDEWPGKCFAMIGLHPCSVNETWEKELIIIEDWLQKRKFSAIGETGLDFYWDKTHVSQQYLALERQIELALKYELPLVLHTRNAMQETIDVIKKYNGTALRGIFHCFGGTADEAQQITGTGFLLGIGGVVTYKNSGLAEVLKKVDIQHLVLETDAPYLAPVPMRGKRNESAYLEHVVKKIAEAKEMPFEDVVKHTTLNAEKLFNP